MYIKTMYKYFVFEQVIPALVKFIKYVILIIYLRIGLIIAIYPMQLYLAR